MPAFRSDTNRDSEYRMLARARPAGPAIGSFKGQLVSSEVTDGSGRRYVYAGVVPRSCHGHYDVELLGPGEWIVEPGLVYRDDSLKPSRSWIAWLPERLPQKVLLKVWIGLAGHLGRTGKAAKGETWH
jgi:hypothetical protein